MSTQHRIWLAGAKFGDGGLIQGEIPEHTPLVLKRDLENQYDPNAVAVYVAVADLKAADVALAMDAIPDDKPLLRLGFLPASRGPNWAAIVAPILDVNGEVIAKFRRHAKTQLRITLEGAALPEVLA